MTGEIIYPNPVQLTWPRAVDYVPSMYCSEAGWCYLPHSHSGAWHEFRLWESDWLVPTLGAKR